MAKRPNDKVWPDELLKPRLDEYLTGKPAVSPRRTVKVGGAEVDVCFRALSRRTIEWLKWEGWRHVLDEMEAARVPDKFIESAQAIDALNNENELRMLHASMIDPDLWEKEQRVQPAFSLSELRKSIVPDEQARLNEQWWIWQTWKSIDNISNEQLELLIEESKKKSHDPVLLTEFGVGGLLICISTMAEEREILLTKIALLTTSGDKDSTEPIPAGNPPETNLQSLFSRLSASLDERVTEAVQPLHKTIKQLEDDLARLKGA